MDKRLITFSGTLITIGLLFGAVFMWTLTPHLMDIYGDIGIGLETRTIHMHITIWKGNNLVLDEYHAGVVTNIGDNITLGWIFGDSSYQTGDYMDNATYISIGNQGSLSESSTQLPGEWNRTAGTIEDQQNSQLNMTCTIYPDTGGPYTADCIGINWKSTGDGNLWGYDVFTEVTGIDETFTINIEFQVSVAHA